MYDLPCKICSRGREYYRLRIVLVHCNRFTQARIPISGLWEWTGYTRRYPISNSVYMITKLQQFASNIDQSHELSSMYEAEIR